MDEEMKLRMENLKRGIGAFSFRADLTKRSMDGEAGPNAILNEMRELKMQVNGLIGELKSRLSSDEIQSLLIKRIGDVETLKYIARKEKERGDNLAAKLDAIEHPRLPESIAKRIRRKRRR